MEIEHLPWDSDFFRKKIGKVNIPVLGHFDSCAFKKNAVKENYDLIYIFKYDNILNQQDISIANLELVDIMITMSKSFDKKECKNMNFELNYLHKN